MKLENFLMYNTLKDENKDDYEDEDDYDYEDEDEDEDEDKVPCD